MEVFPANAIEEREEEFGLAFFHFCDLETIISNLFLRYLLSFFLGSEGRAKGRERGGNKFGRRPKSRDLTRRPFFKTKNLQNELPRAQPPIKERGLLRCREGECFEAEEGWIID